MAANAEELYLRTVLQYWFIIVYKILPPTSALKGSTLFVQLTLEGKSWKAFCEGRLKGSSSL